MWENHKSKCHLKGHILRIHAHFLNWEIVTQKMPKKCVKITLCFVLNLFKAEKKVEICKIQNQRSFIKTVSAWHFSF